MVRLLRRVLLALVDSHNALWDAILATEPIHQLTIRKSVMKRWCIRLSVLSFVAALGCIAIAEAKKTSADPAMESIAANDAVPHPGPVANQAQAFDAAAAREEQNNNRQNPARNSGDTLPAAAPAGESTTAPRRDPFGLGGPPATPPVAEPKQPSQRATQNRYENVSPPADNRYAPAAPIAAPATLPARARHAEPLRAADNTSQRYRDPQNPTTRDASPKATEFDRSNRGQPVDRANPPATERYARATTQGSRFSNRAANATAPGLTGGGHPGGRHLEGPQGPKVVLEKIVPEEIQVGKPTTFDLKVVNCGTVTAYDVQVHDIIPKGTQLLGTKPESDSSNGGTLRWSLGTLEPGSEKYIEVKLMPDAEGEIGSVASVVFATRASGRTLATKPELKIDVSNSGQVMIGDQISVGITISNLGTGVARDIVLFDSLPPEIRHPAGSDLEFAVGDLKPKETRKIELVATAARAGVVKNVLSARGDGHLVAEATMEFEVIAPQLAVSIKGPRRRYLERQATYTVQVANPGTATAEDIELVSRLPRALKFVSANNAGHYDVATHAVYWSLAELPEGEQGSVKLVTLPTESGDHTLRVESTAQGELSDSSEETVRVEGLSALFFEVVDVEDPVEVGGDTAYEIRVLNQGTKVASNIVVTAMLPPDLKPLSTDGPTHGRIQGNQVVFEPLPRLVPKADTTYTVHARGVEPGDQRVQVQIQSDDLRRPVTKEESTTVYADQ